MSGFDRKDRGAPPAKLPAAGPSEPQGKSGRTVFDDRGRAVWEWQVQTGAFDLNADSQKIKALTDVELSLAEPSAPNRPRFKAEGFSPYGAEPSKNPRDAGSNPYSSSGAALKPGSGRPGIGGERAPPPKPRVGLEPYSPAAPAPKRSFNPFNAFNTAAAKKPPTR